MNEVIISGRLTKDVELRYTSSEKAFAIFSVAVNRANEGTDFINCQAWDRTAENLEKYCRKGSMILVNGRLQVEPYEKDGHKRTDIKVVARNIEFIDKRESKPAESKPAFTPTNEPDPFYYDGDQEDLPF